MTDGGTVRVGTAERTAAMKALDQHLSDGRLGVEEYADRSAVAANATVADELRGLFTDLPQPHPVLPGDPAFPVAATGSAPAVPASGAVTRRPGGFMEVAAPRISAAMPILALVLFFATGYQWWWFLLIPAAGALLYGRHHEHEHDRDRSARRLSGDQRRALRDGDS